MGSYMAYKVNTKTNLSFFKKKEASVSRRFSDFLGKLLSRQKKISILNTGTFFKNMESTNMVFFFVSLGYT